VEAVIDKLQKHFAKSEGFRINIIPVEASIPRSEEEKEKKKEAEERVSTEEIYQDLTEVAKISKTYLILVIPAAIVASIGLIKSDVAVIIGSMVIAPLFSPNMALALATTLADSRLAKKAVLTSLAGYATALLIGIIFGMVMKVDLSSPEIASRVDISLNVCFACFISRDSGLSFDNKRCGTGFGRCHGSSGFASSNCNCRAFNWLYVFERCCKRLSPFFN